MVSTYLDSAGQFRLPRGPHRLSREEVEQSQRQRLLIGAAEAVADKGYTATSVADIIDRAGVSRATFYRLFDDKLDCFLAASRLGSGIVMAVLAEEMDQITEEPGLSALDKVDRLLAVYLQTLAENPGFARVYMVEVFAAGSEAIRQRRDTMDQFVALLTVPGEGVNEFLDVEAEQGFGVTLIVAAVSSLVTHAVGTGDVDELAALHAPVMSIAAKILAES